MDNLVEKIVHEVKSQGVFDEFRKDSMADVDTKPAYQNLRQRVDTSVKKFLSGILWTPDLNKNQLREKLRRHITESGFLDVGVERIVDQVVNPKIGSVFQPRIEEIAYKFLGLPPPQKIYDPPPPPLMHPLTAPPLPLAAPPPPLKIETCSLLPNDLEQVSPDSDKATVKSEIEGDDKTEVDMEMDDKVVDDDESPPFEPLVNDNPDIELKMEAVEMKCEIESVTMQRKFKEEDYSAATIKTEAKDYINNQHLNDYIASNIDKDTSRSMDCRNSQDSQYSSVSSDTHLSPVTKNDPPRSSQEDAVTANISEEAQMPKFNESSSEPNGTNGNKDIVDAELHFDIKKDEIKFEGTERKNLSGSQDYSVLDENKRSESVCVKTENKNDTFEFTGNNNSSLEQKEDDMERTPNAQELSFGSSVEDSTSTPTINSKQVVPNDKGKDFGVEEKSLQLTTPKYPSTSTPTETPTATPTPTFSQSSAATPSPVTTQKNERDYSVKHSSSSKHKKHSKERRRSQERERERDRYRSKDSRHHTGGSGKHSSSSSSKYSSSSSHNKSSNEKEADKLYSSHSSSKYGKHSSYSSSEKRHTSSSSHRDHSSSSSASKRSKEDDHQEAKQKLQRRKSTDSNDEGDRGDGGGGGGGGGRSGSQNNKSSISNSKSKSKSNYVGEAPSKNNDVQKDQVSSRNGNKECKRNHNVVILSNLLENPETQCIDLNTQGHLAGLTLAQANQSADLDEIDKCSDLLYFEDMQKSFLDKLSFLNHTMDLCRRAVNSLRFDSPVDEGIEVLSSEDDYNHNITCSLKRKSSSNYEEFEKTPEKRCLIAKGENIVLKTSPSPSDISVSSKENEEIDKNSEMSQNFKMDVSTFVSCNS
ncbi:biorientation of chromosomes in cell division protein 1-like 1 isoform X2 [Stomoxys calcitrans]|uniref:BOD1/SHG1 domain-containing protein n=1 Tax=Stomoxys calcitrans TaxID=35570 RepID=A0A1I8NZ64_STOCA|nr:biorientation of chromosomes in cell division protein 1-like 1 isoform X2 [Stomoxys calcitrans]